MEESSKSPIEESLLHIIQSENASSSQQRITNLANVMLMFYNKLKEMQETTSSYKKQIDSLTEIMLSLREKIGLPTVHIPNHRKNIYDLLKQTGFFYKADDGKDYLDPDKLDPLLTYLESSSLMISTKEEDELRFKGEVSDHTSIPIAKVAGFLSSYLKF